MKWKNLKLRTKLAAGFGLIVLLAVIAGAMATYQTANLVQQSQEYQLAVETEKAILTVRYANTRLDATGLNEYLNMHQEYIETIYSQLSELSETITDTEGKAALAQIETRIKSYNEIFEKERLAQTEKDRLLQLMQQEADEVLQAAANIRQEQFIKLIVIESFLLARIAEKNIVLTGDQSYLQEHTEHINRAVSNAQRLRNQLAGTGDAQYGSTLTEQIEEYNQNFKAFNEQLLLEESYEQQEEVESNAALQAILMLEDAQLAQMQRQQIVSITISLAFLLLVIVIGVLAAILIARTLSRPLIQATKFAKDIANGNYNAMLPINQEDEVGQLGAALNEMLDSLQEGVRYAEKIAQGDLRNSETDVKTNLSPLEKALRLMETKLTEVMANIAEVTEGIATGSKQISASASQVAAGANEQAASTEEVSASMEEMAANINQSTDNARLTEKIAVKSAIGVKKGTNSFKITVEAMREIAGKIKMISEIARKTDVLAINAAIEAARAGEHGKGFAVVANEIRKLAENSQEAATVIEDVVGSSVDVAEESDKILSALLPEVERTSTLVKEITNAGNEQNSGVNQINNAVQELTKVIQENTSAADQMAAGSRSMAAQADALKKAVAFFKTNDFEKLVIAEQAKEPTKPAQITKTKKTKQEDDDDRYDNKSIKLDDYDESDDDFETYK